MPLIGFVFALLWAASVITRMTLLGRHGWLMWAGLAGAAALAVAMAVVVVRRSREPPPA